MEHGRGFLSMLTGEELVLVNTARCVYPTCLFCRPLCCLERGPF